MTNRKPLSELENHHYDVVIIGAGINGCGIAREMALRGASVAVFDKGDIGSGTSSASSKLVHGGIRYLEYGHFGLVREALLERKRLLKNAAHLVHPIPFIIPIYQSDKRKLWQIRIGLWLYDLLAGLHNIKRHHMMSPEEAVQLEPTLNPTGLVGAAVYYDAQMDDARVTLEVALQAQQFGAEFYTYTTVTNLHEQHNTISCVTIEDSFSHEKAVVYCKTLINATGPWANHTLALSDKKDTTLIRPSKGVHIVTKPLTKSHAVLISSQRDNRVFFVIPYGNYSLVGTTDTEYQEHPDFAAANNEDIAYLIEETKRVFPDCALTEADVVSTYAGLRPLIASPKRRIGSVSREFSLVKHNKNMWSLVGGKYTTFRSVAEKTAKTLCKALNIRKFHPLTHTLPLYGGDQLNKEQESEDVKLDEQLFPISKEVYSHIKAYYGSVYQNVLSVICEDQRYKEYLPNSRHVKGEVIYAIRHEMAKRLDDFMCRRTRLFHTPDHGMDALQNVAELFQLELNWNDSQLEEEAKHYQAVIDRYGPQTDTLFEIQSK